MIRRMTVNIAVAPALVVALLCLSTARAESWQAGAAAVDITPDKPQWMSGYAGRSKPAEGTLTKLWAKALVFGPAGGDAAADQRAVLITTDLIGIDRDMSSRICDALIKRYNFKRSYITLSTSHTHTGPVIGRNLMTMYFLDRQQKDRVVQYSAAVEKKIVAVVGSAIEKMQASELSWGSGKATFAVNRRNNRESAVPQLRKDGKLKGPVDHDVPVLAVRSKKDSKLTAVVFGYACHATVLSFYQWSGDYPGFAQIELEKAHPQTVAMFWAGCGGDQNPLPRRKVELAKQYGKRLADSVEAVLAKPMHALEVGFSARYAETHLAFGMLPDRQQLARDAESKNKYVASRARRLIQQVRNKGMLDTTYPYPVQLWKLGKADTQVMWVFLGGEVVVDYALAIKQLAGADRLAGSIWVAAYVNDVMAYIPSLRVLKEGGYEGAGAMVYYGLPAPWSVQVEEDVMKTVKELAR